MKKKEAYLFWNAGVAYINEYPSQRTVCSSRVGNWKRAALKARKLGYHVRVYTNSSSIVLKPVKS